MSISMQYHAFGQHNVTARRKAFRVKKRIAKSLRKRKQNIPHRIDRNTYPTHTGPVLNTPNIQYDLSPRDRGIAYGGIGVVQAMVKPLQLDRVINQDPRVFKIHNPYDESDHVLNIAYNILCQGECLDSLALQDRANRSPGRGPHPMWATGNIHPWSQELRAGNEILEVI